MKTLGFMAMWKRPEVERYCLEKFSHQVDEVLCIVSEAEKAALCEEMGVEWVFSPNNPVGEKMNIGLRKAFEMEWDVLVQVNSDTILPEDHISRCLDVVDDGGHIVGASKCWFINTETGDEKFVDYETMIGAGRVMTRKCLEDSSIKVPVVFNETVFGVNISGHAGKEKYINAYLKGKYNVSVTGPERVMLWPDKDNMLDSNSEISIHWCGYKSHIIDGEVIDLKTKDNIWGFNDVPGENKTVPAWVEREKNGFFRTVRSESDVSVIHNGA